VVTLKGDTIKGFIDYREWDANPESIDFKNTLADKKISKYTADDIDYFDINKMDSFKRYSGHISTDATDPDKVGYGLDTNFRVASVFLHVLKKGNKLALYAYKDEIKTRYYVGEAPAYSPQELIYRRYLKQNAQDDPNQTATVNTYKRQLILLAQKYTELNNLQLYIARADYNKGDIEDIVDKIDKTVSTNKEMISGGGKSVSISVGAGVNINNTSTSSSAPFYTAGGGPHTSYLPVGIFGVNFLANPATGKLQFRIEISVAASKFSSMYNSKVYPYEPTEASYNEMAFSLSPQIIYNFYNAENFKVFGGLGIVLSKYNFSNPYLGSQNHDGSESDIEANNPYFFNTFDDTFIFKAGVQFTKNLAIFASYQSGVSSTKGGYFQLSSTCEQVGLNYIFR
jgi:hypothetical protein